MVVGRNQVVYVLRIVFPPLAFGHVFPKVVNRSARDNSEKYVASGFQHVEDVFHRSSVPTEFVLFSTV